MKPVPALSDWAREMDRLVKADQKAILDRVADKVLAYRVPPRTKKAKKRQRKSRKVQSEA